MTKYIRPDDVLNIYYSISGNNIDEIVNITKENNDITNGLDNLQNVKKIQWSPDKEEHINKTFEFDIEGVSDTRKVRVVDEFNDAIFQWKISEGSNDIIYDDISNQNGVLTQESMWVEGDEYVDNYAIKNNSNNVVEMQNKWNDFGSNMDDDFAIALTIKTTDKGQLLSGYDNNSMRLEWTTRADSDVPGDVLGIMIRDDNNNDGEISSDTIINDGKLHRCVLVKKTNDVHNWEIWIDGKKEDINVHRDAWSANTKNFESPCHFFAVDKGNGLERHLEGVLDNIIFASNSISKTEIVNDYENQPWVNTTLQENIDYYWNMDSGRGPIIDSESNIESNELPEGISWESNSEYNYINFNGEQNEGIDTNVLPVTGDSNRAFFMWVNINNTKGTFLEYGSSSNNTQWRWRLDNGKSRVENEDTGAVSSLNIPTNEWVPIGVILDGDNLSDITFYVDGETDKDENTNSNINTGTNNNLTFGFSPVNDTQKGLNGKIGMCVGWNTNVSINVFENIVNNTKHIYNN